MKPIKTMLRASILSMSACLASAANAENTFSITMSNGIAFDQDSERAVIWGASAEYLVVSGHDRYKFPKIILEARNLGDTPVSRTTDIGEGGYGDSHFRVELSDQVGGERTKLFCRAAKVGTGWVQRSELTETHVAGSFEIEVAECADANGTPIAYEALPFIVSGTFSLDICGMFVGITCKLD